MKFTEFLSLESIFVDIEADSKKNVFKILGNLFAKKNASLASTIINRLNERERLGSTSVGNGVAIPHVKIRGLTKICGFFSSLERPIDFEAADKQPVDLIFTLLAPENNKGTEHLKALAMVSRVFNDKNIRAKLRSSENTDSLFAILTINEDSKAA